MGAPSAPHEERRRVLDALAVLTGYTVELPSLPDGSRPDVARMNGRRRSLFLGEAKDTETARRTDTQIRLVEYARWLAAATTTGSRGVLAVCFGRSADRARWVATLFTVA